MQERNPYEPPESAKKKFADETNYYPKIEVFHKVKDLRILAIITKVILSLCIASAITFLLIAIFASEADLELLVQLDTFWEKLTPFYSITFYVSMLFVAIWQIESMKNAWIIKLSGKLPVNTPVLSVVMYFMPIVCWWIPFQAVREICTNSMEKEFVPHVWLRFWWGMWLITFYTGFGGTRNIHLYLSQQGSLVNLTVSVVALVAAAASLIIIISRVTLHQYRLHEKHGNEVV